MEQGHAGGLGSRSDQKIGVGEPSVISAALVREGLVDVERAAPLAGADKALRNEIELCSAD